MENISQQKLNIPPAYGKLKRYFLLLHGTQSCITTFYSLLVQAKPLNLIFFSKLGLDDCNY